MQLDYIECQIRGILPFNYHDLQNLERKITFQGIFYSLLHFDWSAMSKNGPKIDFGTTLQIKIGRPCHNMPEV